MTFKLGIFTSVKAFFSIPVVGFSLPGPSQKLCFIQELSYCSRPSFRSTHQPPHTHTHNNGPPHYGHAHAGNLMVFVLIRKVRKMLVVTRSGRRKVLVS